MTLSATTMHHLARSSTLTRLAKPAGLAIAGLATLLASAAPASAQTITVLQQSFSFQFSQATSVWGTLQGGYYDNGYSFPRLWSGSAASGITLAQPNPDSGSHLNALSATQGVGDGYVRTTPSTGYYAALLWSLPGGALTVLTPPPGFTGTYGWGCGGNQQVGRGEDGESGAYVPALWTGTAASFVNLLPAGFGFGDAYATDGIQQVGSVYATGVGERAALWTGTPGSFVNLHPGPPDAGSVAKGVSAGRQCGYFYDAAYVTHACVWQGTAASFVDLHPVNNPTIALSQASGISGSVICGTLGYGPAGRTNHAAVWLTPSASSLIDLHASLGPAYDDSSALGVWTDGSVIRVVGYATPHSTGNSTAVMWTISSTVATCCVGSACQVVTTPSACAGALSALGTSCGPMTCCAAPMGTSPLQDCDGDMVMDLCTALAPQADCNNAGGPDSCETLSTLVTDFYYNNGPYTFNGAANLDESRAVLTTAQPSQAGSIILPPQTAGPTSRLRAIFDFRISPSTTIPSDPGDGFSFSLLDAATYTTTAVFGEDGPGPGSLTVKFNTFANTPTEGNNSMFIRYNGVDVASNLSLPFTLIDSQWHRCIIDITPGGRVSVRLATNPGDATTVFDAVQVPGYTPFRALVGFGARTGGAFEQHEVRSIRIGVNAPNDANGDGIPDSCACPQDFDGDTHINVQDIFAFLAAWFNGNPRADFNHSGAINVQDIFDFLAAWFHGC